MVTCTPEKLWELLGIRDLIPVFACLLYPPKMLEKIRLSTTPLAMQTCIQCDVSKPFDQFRTLRGGITTRCIACLGKIRAKSQATKAAKREATLQTLPTLNDFYIDLEAAKEHELHNHTILFNSKEASAGNSVRTVRIASLGDRDELQIDPSTKEGFNSCKVIAERIAHQCGEILGYRWRYVVQLSCR